MSDNVLVVRVTASDCKSTPFRNRVSRLMLDEPDDDIVTMVQPRAPTNFGCKVIVAPKGPLTGLPFDPNKT